MKKPAGRKHKNKIALGNSENKTFDHVTPA